METKVRGVVVAQANVIGLPWLALHAWVIVPYLRLLHLLFDGLALVDLLLGEMPVAERSLDQVACTLVLVVVVYPRHVVGHRDRSTTLRALVVEHRLVLGRW